MVDHTKHHAHKVQNEISNSPEKSNGPTDDELSAIDYYSNSVMRMTRETLDTLLVPEKRAGLFAKMQAFMSAHPKLSTFVGVNIALTGIPLILFSLSIFVSALIVGLVVGFLAAALFTLAAVGIGMLVIVPIVVFTTGLAFFLFFWGLCGYYIFKWANSERNG